LDENEDLAGTGWAESIGFQVRGSRSAGCEMSAGFF
jgi:hypothetical protein